MTRLIWAIALLCCVSGVSAQTTFDSLELRPLTLPGAPALHSGAWAQWEGSWYFIGGRTNGLHGFLPPLAFPASGRNESVWEVNPTTGVVRSADLSVLPVPLYEAVTTSNLQFYRQDSVLYLVGGYGWNDSASTFLTYPTLTALNLSALRNALDGTAPLADAFRQLRDSRLAVCGAHLGKVDDTYLLPWGHRFDGIYDRSDTTGFFEQEYTYAIRRFGISDDGSSLALTSYTSSTDTAQFRRRDYNLVPQVMPSGEYAYTGFTGVFQEGIDLPYLNTVDMGETWQAVVPAFEQRLSQYHSAFAPLHDGSANRMTTLFFGGMSQYYIDSVSGLLAEDTLVPFVRTISKVTRFSDGSLEETALPFEMPGLSGTNCHFIPDPARTLVHHEVISIDGLMGEVRIGWLYGGITSPQPHISDTDPSLSWATPEIYEVWLRFTEEVGVQEQAVVEPVALKVNPNPVVGGRLHWQITAGQLRYAKLTLLNAKGHRIREIWSGNVEGVVEGNLELHGVASQQCYLSLETKGYSKATKVVITN